MFYDKLTSLALFIFLSSSICLKSTSQVYKNSNDDKKEIQVKKVLPPCPDTDNDGIDDCNDLDDDNDGILDTDECGFIPCDEPIVNGGFEQPAYPANTLNFTNEAIVNGWETTATDNIIEFWGNGFQGVPAFEGSQYVELNANQVSTLFQTLCLTPGTILEWSVRHRGRLGVDTAEVRIGASLATATTQVTMSDGNNAWGYYSGTYQVPVGQLTTVFAFVSINGVGGASIGNFIDDIQVNIITPAPCQDTDNDGIPDSLDEDSDGDGCYDVIEGGGTDPDNDGVLGVSSPVGSGNVTVDANGLVIGQGGYGTPIDSDGTAPPDFQEVSSLPILTIQPQDQTITGNGANVVFTANATIPTGNGSLVYQWQESTDNGTTWINLTDNGQYNGTATNTLTIASPPISFEGNLYRLVVRNPFYICDIVISDEATILVDLEPFLCDDVFYQVISGQLNVLDPSSGTYTPLGPGFEIYNAMGYNPIDNFLYAIIRANEPNEYNLIKIGNNGVSYIMGVPVDVVSGAPLNSGVNAGAFDDSQFLWVRATGASSIFKIDVTNVTYELIPLSTTIGSLADFTFIDGKLYGTHNNILFELDIATNPVTVTQKTVTGLPTGGYGAAYNDVLGNLYVSNNNGGIYRIIDFDTPNPTAVFLINSVPTSVNDGANCPSCPIFDLETAGSNGTIELCSDSAIVDLFSLLGGNPETGGTWSGPSGLTNDDQGTYTPGTNMPGVYTYTVDNGVCPESTAEINVVEHAKPNIAALADVIACDNYTLPAISVGNYYTGSGGSGTVLNVGDVITTSQTIYVYAETGTIPNCSDELSFELTINNSPNIISSTDVTVCDSYVLPALATGNYYTSSGGSGTLLNVGDIITTTQTVYVYAETGTTPNCTAEESFIVTINMTPNISPIADVTACDNYVLPTLAIGNYYTGSGGTGTLLNTGDVITTTQTIYVYAETGTTPNCYAEDSFIVTINTTPSITPITDITACDSYVLPALAVGSYYTGSGGSGNLLNVGDVITTTQTIYVYAETGTTPNCTSEEIFEVTINTTPNVIAPTDVTVCDSYILPILAVGNYYTNPGGSGTLLNAGDEITITQNVYVYAETGTNPNCSDEESFLITVNDTPVVASIDDVITCGSYILPTLTSQGNYYTGLGGTGTLLNAGDTVTTTQTIYVYAETGTSPNCSTEESFLVTITPNPIINTVADIEQCDDDSDGFMEFDLTSTMGTIIGGQSEMVVTYYETQADALAGTGAMNNASSYTNTSSPQTIYVRIENETMGCYGTMSFDIIANTVTAVEPTPLAECEQDNDGFTTFTLSDAINQITGNNPALDVYFYETLAEAEADQNVINDGSNPDGTYNNIDPYTQIIYIRVTDPSTGCSYVGTTLILNVIDKPNVPEGDVNYTLCDSYNDLTDGVTQFDLTSLQTELLANATPPVNDYTIVYYAGLDGNGNPDPATQIANPLSYENTSNPQVIYASVLSVSTGCSAVKAITLSVDVPPVLLDASYEYQLCDDDYYTSEDPTHPQMVFDLLSITGAISAESNVTFTFYQLDPNTNAVIGAITNPGSYINVLANPESVMVEVTDNTTGCTSTGLVTLEVFNNPSPLSTADIATNLGAMASCNNDGTGLGTLQEGYALFDLTDYETAILTGTGPGVEPGVVATYYMSEGDAVLDENPIADPTLYYNTIPFAEDEWIYVRVTNATTGCYIVVSFELDVPVPMVSITGGNIICVDEHGIPLATNALPVLEAVGGPESASSYDYQWSLNGVEIPGATNQTLTVTQSGTYSVSVAGPIDMLCENFMEYEVTVSSGADTYDVEVTTDAFSDPHQIIATANSPIAGVVFEYSLDGGVFTSDGVFTGVSPGMHEVTIRDEAGCWETTVPTAVIGYPQFFTPNGDGINDTWQIIGIEGIPISQIYIFDRFGKLLKQLDPDGIGWNGTYNGAEMPATDYWFKIIYLEGDTSPTQKEFTAHFSLKR